MLTIRFTNYLYLPPLFKGGGTVGASIARPFLFYSQNFPQNAWQMQKNSVKYISITEER